MAGVTFLPIPAGTGDPSPTNVRPISPGLTITGIGDIYGGYLDVARAKLVETDYGILLDGTSGHDYVTWYGTGEYGTDEWTHTYVSVQNVFPAIGNNPSKSKCSFLPYDYANATTRAHYCKTGTINMFLSKADFPDTTGVKSWLAENPQIVVMPFSTPITHALTSAQLAEAMQKLGVQPSSLLARRRRLVMAQPHLASATPANPVSFAATLAAPLKGLECAFSPVQAAGTPAPDNVLPISGWTNCNVVRCGKNLFGGTLGSGTYVDINVVAGQKYTISAKMVDASVSTFLQVKRTPTGQESWETVASPISNYTVAAKTFTVESGYRYALYSNSSYTNVTDVQLELGSTATSYAPYTGQTLAVQFPAEAGTIYGGYIDPVRGVARAEWGMETLDGTESYNNYTSVVVCRKNVPAGAANGLISNRAVTPDFGWSSNNRNSFQFVKSAFGVSDETELKALFATWASQGSPIMICYRLATPIEYPLTPAVLKTLKGANVIYTSLNGNVSPIYWTN